MAEQIKSNNMLENIKSKYILEKNFNIVQKKKYLEIIVHNKNIQQRLNLNIKNYQEYSQTYTPIEIEIISIKNTNSKITNINNKEDEKYFHIYIDNNKEEIKTPYLTKEDKFSKVRIIIEHQIKSFFGLFSIVYIKLKVYLLKNFIEIILLIWDICFLNVHH